MTIPRRIAQVERESAEYLCAIKTALVPPNPNELDITIFMSAPWLIRQVAEITVRMSGIIIVLLWVE
jgi:hypothetical protein